MRTSEHGDSGGPETTDVRPTSHGNERSGPPRRAIAIAAAFAAAFAIAFAAAAGAGVYVWQHEQVRDRDALIAAAVQERDEARREADALMADADRADAEILSLRAEVAGLAARVERLRSLVGEPNGGSVAPLACSASDILAAVRAQVPIAEPMVWDSVTIQACRGGYAFVLAHPGNVPPGTQVEESEQVFLRNDGGEWTVIGSGTGISCSDPDIPPELEQACTALGLP